MRILLTGAQGQLGRRLLPGLRQLGEVVAVGRGECDLASPEAIVNVVAQARPSVIVNAAAYTAVNEAETHADLARAVNCDAPAVLAREARKLDAMFVHYSTDYVFDGTKRGAYTEDDTPAPLNVYGATKLAGEQAVSAAGGRFLVLRTSWVYGAEGSNFLLTMRRLAREREDLRVVNDQIGAPTSTGQLASATERLIAQCASREAAEFPCGVYHLTAAGETSWCGFAEAIVDTLRQWEPLRVRRVIGIPGSEYPTPARRPLNSILSNERFARTFGFKLESWQAGLAQVMDELRASEGR